MTNPKLIGRDFTLSIENGEGNFVPIGVSHAAPKFELPTGVIEIECNFEGKISWVDLWHLQALTAPPN
jgi:hypothetical protein